MRYPALLADKRKLGENTEKITALCHERGIKAAAVTKVYGAMPELVRVQARSGVDWIADSRLENLARITDIPVPKLLLRLPMISQAGEVVKLADASLVSELSTCRALSDAAVEAGSVHSVILMVDVGDLREGVWPDRAVETAGEILSMPGLKLMGVGTNLTCYGAVLPSPENLGLLVSVASDIESAYGVKLGVISGGNSSSIKLMLEGKIPSGVNMLRLGESMTIGKETADGTLIPGLHDDVFTLEAEIIELKTKPSVPIGERGRDAFGREPVFEDKGIIKRAIVAVGQQDMVLDGIVPKDRSIQILGASSDHMILDVTKSPTSWKVGDIVPFNLSYGGVLAACTSAYVSKVLI